jgi:membrane associated rhomboid family serine protease
LTTIIIIITIIISAAALQNKEVMGKLIFNPYMISHRNEWYRFFSSGFIHADVVHLAVNMIVLYSFGNVLEAYYGDIGLFAEKGRIYYVILYVSALVFSIMPTYNNHKDNMYYNGLGASGAVSAVMFAVILLDPISPIKLYGVFGLPGVIYGLLYLYFCYYMNKRGGDNINHSAHAWGAIYGFTFALFIRPSLIADFFQHLIRFRNAI